MTTILEPCCKTTQFSKFLEKLGRFHKDDFAHYGDVEFKEWFGPLMLEAKGAEAQIRLNRLELSSLMYICHLLSLPAFIPGRKLRLLNKATITAKELPEHTPNVAEGLIKDNRIIKKKSKKAPKLESITLTTDNKVYRLSGNFFAESPTTPRKIHIEVNDKK